MPVTPLKPLGGKAYGSIPHLPGSRLGPGDWSLNESQARICLEQPRPGDRVIATEKVDGSCLSVANVQGDVVPLIRAGYRAEDADYEHLRLFAPWTRERCGVFAELLAPGERICGEWMLMAIGTRYDPDHPGFDLFLAFDIFRDGKRVLHDEFSERVTRAGLARTRLLHDGPSAFSIEDMEGALGETGGHGALERAEGAVWRVEREGQVKFLAKYVRADKIDGKYLPEVSGEQPVWHRLNSAVKNLQDGQDV